MDASDHSRPRSVWAVVAAAGEGRRFGTDLPKQFVPAAGAPLLHHTLRALRASACLDGLVAVVPAGRLADPELLPAEMRSRPDLELRVVAGGARRRDSVRCGLEALPASCDVVLVHDGARPAVSRSLVERVLAGVERSGACVPVLPVAETVWEIDASGRARHTRLRDRLRLAQTPQGFSREILEAAYARPVEAELTDDASLVESAGYPVETVAGDPENIKVTVPADLVRLGLGAPRVGFGYDVHRLVEGRRLVLGGVEIPSGRGLEGHSDADVALHALCDAVLGAAGCGDIGRLFPDDDARWAGADSLELLRLAVGEAARAGFRPSSADLTIVAERPKLAAYLPRMADRIAPVLGVERHAVTVKATTSEGLGFAGEGRGMAAYATAVLVPGWRGPADSGPSRPGPGGEP
ncbi:MAG: 2-C-methyl-D-erythritol 4-phosphate cytidylyltransferase [Deltaproteobacteria bacterium]|nr:2-C-methyl-D-erythritol 4-phosphate cytidylyltransferase [Deltaproteobacteria bacterium]